MQTADRIEIDAVTRIPQTRLIRLVIELDSAGGVERYELTNDRPPDGTGPNAIRTIAEYSGDSVRFSVQQGNTYRGRTVRGGSRLYPFISPLYSPFQAALQITSPADSTLLLLSQQTTYRYWVRALAGDTVGLVNDETGTLRVRVDDRGRILEVDGSRTTFKVEVTRVDSVDIRALASMFARRDARDKPLGQLSPRDTARVVIDGASITIDYGRPAARGRVVFGGLVPWDEVWRTGANAATQIETARPIAIGAMELPAGKYTLWTIPGPTQWMLIVNRQTGQWGTQYNRLQDFGRVGMQPDTLEEPVERFTIEMKPFGGGATIVMSWDRTKVEVPFRVR